MRTRSISTPTTKTTTSTTTSKSSIGDDDESDDDDTEDTEDDVDEDDDFGTEFPTAADPGRQAAPPRRGATRGPADPRRVSAGLHTCRDLQ